MFSSFIVLQFVITCSVETLLFKMCFGHREQINALGMRKEINGIKRKYMETK